MYAYIILASPPGEEAMSEASFCTLLLFGDG